MTTVLERPAALLVLVSRPWFWPVSWVPAYLGTVLAGHAWLPGRAHAGRAVVALRFGARFAYRLGIALWGSALAFSLACAGLDVLVPRSTLPAQLLMAPVLLGVYAILTRRPTITKLALVSLVFGVPTIGFALAYIGA